MLMPTYNRTEALLISWILNRGKCLEKKEQYNEDEPGWIPCTGASIKKSLPIFGSDQSCWNTISRLCKKGILETRKVEGVKYFRIYGQPYAMKHFNRHVNVSISKVGEALSWKDVPVPKKSRIKPYTHFMKCLNMRFSRPQYFTVYFALVKYLKQPDAIVFLHWIINNAKMGNKWMSKETVTFNTGISKHSQLRLLKQFEEQKILKRYFKIPDKSKPIQNRMIKINYKVLQEIIYDQSS